MKKCPNKECAQMVGESVSVCPHCGSAVEAGQSQIDDYMLLDLIRDTAGGAIYRAQKKGTNTDVLVRILPEPISYSPEQARRINDAMLRVNDSDGTHLVKHIDLRQSQDGRWYRVSEWLKATAWGDLTGSRFFMDPRNKQKWIDLFIQMALALQELHQTGLIIPNLCLKDLLLYQDSSGKWCIKLDYKLFSQSRDDAGASPEIQKRMKLHPDILNNRPFDFRSDIWSLGRLMLELLVDTDEFEDSQGMLDKIREEFKPIVLHRKLSSLLRAMVEDDSDKRPTSMDLILKSLREITPEDIVKWDEFSKDPTKQKKLGRNIRRYAYTAAGIVIVIFVLLFLYERRQSQEELARISEQTKADVVAMEATIQGDRQYIETSIADQLAKALVDMKNMLPEQKITLLTQKYKRSVAFVLVDIYLESGDKKALVGRSSGTAFLVSSQGYMLTNRHVACPWLGDEKIPEAFKKAVDQDMPLTLGYNLYLWFDGDHAFRTAASSADSNKTEDQYRVDLAYSNLGDTDKTVSIVGAMRFPRDVLEQVRGLRDDVAVLKVNKPPEDAIPIPLNGVDTISKGAPIIVLGYPYGRQSIVGENAESRCTNGIVTRAFGNVITTNATLHGGNSGGPVIDLNGFAVGIASAVFTGGAQTGQADMGWVYPISKARVFLDEIMGGMPKWRGLPDYVFVSEIEKARNAALAGNQKAVRQTVEALTKNSSNANLNFWGGVLTSRGNTLSPVSRAYFKRCIQLDPENAYAKFILYRADVLSGKPFAKCAYRDELVFMPWYDGNTLFRFLALILEEQVPMDLAVQLGDSSGQAAIINWAGAAVAMKNKDDSQADQFLKTAFDLADKDSVTGALIQLEMNAVGVAIPKAPSGQVTSMELTLEQLLQSVNKQKQTRSKSQEGPYKARSGYIKQAFEFTQQGKWAGAIQAIDAYLKYPQWEASVRYLEMRLLYGQVLALDGQSKRAKKELEAFGSQVKNSWYRTITQVLLGQVDEKEARKIAGDHRELILTLEFALGLNAEAKGKMDLAAQHYNNVLDTCKIDWQEFTIAKKRRDHIRTMQK